MVCRCRRRMRANTSRALRESKWNRNLPCNGAARGRQTCRRRESLGTDSRVLCRVRPFNTSINAFGENFFCVAELTARASSYAKDFPARYRCRVELSRHGKNCDSAETLNSSAFLQRADFCAGICARGRFFATAERRRCSRASLAKAGKGNYTQNLVERLFFFPGCSNPVVVPVDSRRH